MIEHDDLFLEALDVFRLKPKEKRIRKPKSKHCNICNTTIKHKHNFPEHCLSNIHISNVEKMYKPPCIQESAKKRKHHEEYLNAVELFTTLKEKKTDPTEMR